MSLKKVPASDNSLTESEKMQLAIVNAVKEALIEGSATPRTRDATGEHITVAYLDCVCIDDTQTITDIIVLLEGGRYGGLGVVQLPIDSSDHTDLQRACSGEANDDNEEAMDPGTIPPFGREALTWKSLFKLAVTEEPTILRRLLHIAKDSFACGAILKPLFESAIRDGKVQIHALLGGGREN